MWKLLEGEYVNHENETQMKKLIQLQNRPLHNQYKIE